MPTHRVSHAWHCPEMAHRYSREEQQHPLAPAKYAAVAAGAAALAWCALLALLGLAQRPVGCHRGSMRVCATLHVMADQRLHQQQSMTGLLIA